MYSYLYIRLILLLFTLSALFGYENLYLMKFDNVSRDSNINYLAERLPEIIIDNFNKEDYVNILYAPKIIPVLYENNSNLDNGILLNGKFLSSYDNIIISFEAFDVNSWEKKTFRSYYCNINDQDCIDNALLVSIKENILPLFCPFYDCLGVCKGKAVNDCLGVCNGASILDCMGECNGLAKDDCSGICNGSASLDNCGNCNSDPQNNCIQDCNGDWGGGAFLNICGMCVGGNTNVDTLFGMDCLGNCEGDAIQDCNGDCQGSAYLNECNVCVGGNTNNNINKGLDCEGVCFGISQVDYCGVCNGDNSSCSDCLGVPFGKATIDMCGFCDDDYTNDCVRDCNGDFGGTAYLNECSVCVGGSTNLDANTGLDCNNVCWGAAKLDKCGICNGENQCSSNDIFSKTQKNKNIDLNHNIKDVKKIYLHNTLKNDAYQKSNKQSFSLDIEENTNKLFLILDDMKKSLYDYEINNIDNNIVNDKILLDLPVVFSLNQNFLKKFEKIPHIKKRIDNGSILYKINKLDFNISPELDMHFSLMKYQIVPVMFFIDRNDNIGSIIINSWNDGYSFNIGTKYNVDIKIINQFQTKVSIMPGKDSVSFIFDTSNLLNDYQVYLKNEDYNNFDYVYISFFYEHSLESDIKSYIINRYNNDH